MMNSPLKRKLVQTSRRVMRHYASSKRNTMPVTRNAVKSFKKRMMRAA